MNNLEKYLDQVIEQRPAGHETPLLLDSEPDSESSPNVLRGVLRRWYIVLAVAVVIGAAGLPAVWFLVEPLHTVRGAVRVAPVIESVLTGEGEGRGGAGYRDLVNTQVTVLTSGPVLQRIADDLASRNLRLFSGEPQTPLAKLRARFAPKTARPDPAVVLKRAVASGAISAGHIPQTELVAVTMKAVDAAEAIQVVNAFLTHYQNKYGADSIEAENARLRVLTAKQAQLLASITTQREEIRRLADEFGTTVLDTRHDMEVQTQNTLRAQWIALETRRIRLETSIAVLAEAATDVNMPPEQIVAARKEYVNSDPEFQQLSQAVVQMKRELLVARQNYRPENPALTKQEELLIRFEQATEDRRKVLEEEFDAGLQERLNMVAQQRLKNVQLELQELIAYQEKLRAELKDQDTRTQKVGQTNLDIQSLQFRLSLDQELYDQVTRQIRLMEMEGQGRPRITPSYSAYVVQTEDRRPKLAGAVLFAGLAAGFGLAFLRNKADKTLQTPEDMTRYLGLPVLGTTTSSHTIKPAQFAEQIASDYQTIRTNLGLLANGGIPHKLAVCSPRAREGKTTFAVNLATSLAKSGKKVLLIDGDLRKPDVRYMLNVPNGSGGTQDVLLGEDPSKAVCTVPSSGLHVLAASSRCLADAYELLASSTAAQQIEKMSREYDHVIVDTPPVLAFPDAMVWAKLTDAVILVGFAGQTTAPDLAETKERFARIRAHVVGAILSNVRAEQGLCRYDYGYRIRSAPPMRQSAKQKKLLLSIQGRDEQPKE
ncbi:polysaccharide biosynthesis tyrosine autokinase [Anaerobaca lacustris]|uniref:Polysaccharide biosynthesis tyrosine autokinase n=1 Tax=Anaerobaca lacustris TaxID=3044600 RepID=A0AAW6TZA6_9BACT|nr:polysaccharide biosynthesis tyrosine autokinase [Sedimentisphaerales bacterium M17dextr]